MIPYIGDLSLSDAFTLKSYAEEAKSILEFGVGASTQILRHYSKGEMISVETMQEWIDRTEKNFKLIGVEGSVEYKPYDEKNKGNVLSGTYDLIFVDGYKKLRREFAMSNWRHLSYGGVMIFHDTRKMFHTDYVGEVIKRFFPQIKTIIVNQNNSNLTIIEKRRGLKYENWNRTENKKAWMYGRGEFNEEEFQEYKSRMTKS